MQSSDEEENFIKITKLVLDIFPRYLRKCFIEQWNKKFPNQKWTSNNASGTFFVKALPPRVQTNRSRSIYIDKLMEGKEQDWDTTTVVYALLETGLQLVEGSRAKDERKKPLRISEQIELIRDVRNFVAHASSMSCPSTKFTEVLKEIKSKATDIFDATAVQEIEEIETSPVESQMAGDLKKRLELEKQRNKNFGTCLTGEFSNTTLPLTTLWCSTIYRNADVKKWFCTESLMILTESFTRPKETTLK